MAGTLTLEDAYRQARRGDFAPVYYLTGDQEILKDDLVAHMVDHAVDPATRDFNVDVRAAGDLDGESLHTLIETPPMMADRRAVVIRGVEQWRKNARVWKVVDRYLESPSPTTVAIFVHGAGQDPASALERHAVHVKVDLPRRERVVAWVVRRAERAGVGLTPQAAEHLVEAVGGDLAQVAAEVEKLAAVAPESTTLDVGEVGALIGVRRGETVADWVDAALRRDVTRAIGMVETVLSASGVNGVRLVTALGTALVGTRLARAYADRGWPAQRVERELFQRIKQSRPAGLGSWRVEAKRWTAASRAWTAAELDHAIRTAYEADRALKSTTVTDEPGTLAGMLLRFGARKAVA
jgi:DNA polymerase-3 subunit delta